MPHARACALANTNPHSRDDRIQFEEEGHTYYIDGKRVSRSVSAVLDLYFARFDPHAVVEKYFARWKVDPASKYYQMIKDLELVDGMGEEEQKRAIVRLWAARGEEASCAGTEMHAQIEHHLNGAVEDGSGGGQSVEFDQYLQWRKSFFPERQPMPYRTEWSVYDEEAGLAGQIDSLWKGKDGAFFMVDWKRCSPAGRRTTDPLQPLGPHVPAFRWETGIGPCSRLPHTPFFHYCIQQNLYKYILERHYGIKVERMFLAQFHPLLPSFHSVEVPDMQDVTREIMEALYEERQRMSIEGPSA